MAKKKILDQYRRGPAPEPDTHTDTDTPVDTKVETVSGTPPTTIRGNLVAADGFSASMLDLRFRNGVRRAFPYSYLNELTLDPAGSLVLKFPSVTITITGRQLGVVYQAVTNHSAIAILEDVSGYDDGKDQPYVQSIVIETITSDPR